MSKIRIQNFGPIKQGCVDNDGWIDIEKVTVFIGNQGSGKSTVAKMISTMTWLEKAINRGDFYKDYFTNSQFEGHFEYQVIQNYFRENSIIEYIGNKMTIRYAHKNEYLDILYTDIERFNVPKIMYVPAERNFLSVIDNPYSISNLPYALKTFAEELLRGLKSSSNLAIGLPIGDVKLIYKTQTRKPYLIGNNYELDLAEASSGYQSLVPLYIVSKSLSNEIAKGEIASKENMTAEQFVRRNNAIANVMLNKTLAEDQKIWLVKEIEAKFINTCLINIVEEPEQNLFPTSQRIVLNNLLEINNEHEKNRLIVTTHSPYLINYLTLAIEGRALLNKMQAKGNVNSELILKFYKIIPSESLVAGNDVAIYELDETNGTIKRLPTTEGIPSDKNYLNQSLRDCNNMFDALLEIEQEL